MPVRKRRVRQKPPIAERDHWREVLKLKARDIHASDALVYRAKGSAVKRYLTIIEKSMDKNGVELKCMDAKHPSGYQYFGFKHNERVTVRRTFHD